MLSTDPKQADPGSDGTWSSKGQQRETFHPPRGGESSCGEPCAHPHIGLLLFFIPGMQAGRGGFLPGDSVLLPVGERRAEGIGARLRVELELQACRGGEGGEAGRESMCKPGTFGTLCHRVAWECLRLLCCGTTWKEPWMPTFPSVDK